MKDKYSQIRSQSRTNRFMFKLDKGETFQNIALLVFRYSLAWRKHDHLQVPCDWIPGQSEVWNRESEDVSVSSIRQAFIHIIYKFGTSSPKEGTAYLKAEHSHPASSGLSLHHWGFLNPFSSPSVKAWSPHGFVMVAEVSGKGVKAHAGALRLGPPWNPTVH